MTITIRKIKDFRLILVVLAISIVSLLAFRAYFHINASAKPRVEVIRVPGGWGYQVLLGERVYIDQPFMPGLPGKIPFPDRRSALKAGNMVKLKLSHGRHPELTPADMTKIP